MVSENPDRVSESVGGTRMKIDRVDTFWLGFATTCLVIAVVQIVIRAI